MPQGSAQQSLVQEAPWSRHGSYSAELLAMVRQNRHPLSAYGAAHLAPRLSAALARVLAACHASFGAYRLFGSTRWVLPWNSQQTTDIVIRRCPPVGGLAIYE